MSDGGAAVRRIVQIDARPVQLGRRLAGGAAPALDPGAERNQEQPEHEDPGQDQEEDDPDVRVGVQPEQVGEEHDQEQRRR